MHKKNGLPKQPEIKREREFIVSGEPPKPLPDNVCYIYALIR